MADSEYRVIYRAIADFSELYASIAAAKGALKSLNNDTDHVAGAAKQAAALKNQADGHSNVNRQLTQQHKTLQNILSDRLGLDRSEQQQLLRSRQIQEFQQRAQSLLAVGRQREAAIDKLHGEALAKEAKDAAKSAADKEKADKQSASNAEKLAAAVDKAHGQAIEQEKRRQNEVGKAQGQAIEQEKRRQEAINKTHGQAIEQDKRRLQAQAREEAAEQRLADRRKERQDRETKADNERAARLVREAERRAAIEARQEARRLDSIARIEQRERDVASRREAREVESERNRIRREEAAFRRQARRTPYRTLFGRAAADFIDTQFERRPTLADDRPSPLRRLLSGGRFEPTLGGGSGDRVVRRDRSQTRELRRALTQSGNGIGTNVLTAFSNAADNIGRSLSSSGTRILSFRTLILALLAALGPLVAALGNLGAALVAVANAASAAVGALGYLPSLVGVAAQAFGALYASISPIVDVLQAYGDVQKASVKSNSDQADAIKDQTRAQQALNDARKQALRDLQDLRTEVDRASLDEEGAILALRRAKADYRKTLADPDSTLLDREEAAHRVKVAENDLADVRTDNKRNREDLADAEKRGVEGSQPVLAAKDALATANKSAAGSTTALVKAQEELARQLAALGPSTRRFAQTIIGLADAWKTAKKEIGEAFFSKFTEEQLKNFPAFFKTFTDILNGTAGVLGGVLSRAFDRFFARGEDFKKFGASNDTVLKNLGDGAFALADALLNIAVAAGPSLEALSRTLKGVFDRFDAFTKKAAEDGSIKDFFDNVNDVLGQLGQIIENLGGAFKSLFFASQDFTNDFLESIIEGTQGWEDWAEKQEAAGSGFKNFLENSKEPLKAIAALLGAIVEQFFKMAGDQKNIDEMVRIFNALKDDVLPAIVKIFSELSESNTISTLIESLGTLLDVLAKFLDEGGSFPLVVLANGFALLAKSLSFLLDIPGVPILLTAIGTAMAALAAVAVIGKFTGLFLLFKTIAGFMRLMRGQQGNIFQRFGRGISDLARDNASGSPRGTAEANRYGRRTPEEINREGLYKPQLTTIIGLLRDLVACCKSMAKGGGPADPDRPDTPSGDTPNRPADPTRPAPDVDRPSPRAQDVETGPRGSVTSRGPAGERATRNPRTYRGGAAAGPTMFGSTDDLGDYLDREQAAEATRNQSTPPMTRSQRKQARKEAARAEAARRAAATRNNLDTATREALNADRQRAADRADLDREQERVNAADRRTSERDQRVADAERRRLERDQGRQTPRDRQMQDAQSRRRLSRIDPNYNDGQYPRGPLRQPTDQNLFDETPTDRRGAAGDPILRGGGDRRTGVPDLTYSAERDRILTAQNEREAQRRARTNEPDPTVRRSTRRQRLRSRLPRILGGGALPTLASDDRDLLPNNRRQLGNGPDLDELDRIRRAGLDDIDETVSRVPGARRPSLLSRVRADIGRRIDQTRGTGGSQRGSLGYNFASDNERRGRAFDEADRRRREGLAPETDRERDDRELRQRTEYRTEQREQAIARRQQRAADRERTARGGTGRTGFRSRVSNRLTSVRASLFRGTRTPIPTVDDDDPTRRPTPDDETDEQRTNRERTERRAQQRAAAEQRRAQRQRRQRRRGRVGRAGGRAAGLLALGTVAYDLTNGFDFGGGDDEASSEPVDYDEDGNPIYEEQEEDEGSGLASTAGLLALGFAPDLIAGGANRISNRTPRAGRAGGSGGRLSRLLRGGARGAGAAGTRAAGSAGRLGRLAGGAGKLLKGGGILGIGGLLVGGAAEAGVFGGKGSTGKQVGSAAGAALTGAGIGATIGSIIPGVGTAIGGALGALGGLVYSLVKDKGLRDKIGKFFTTIGDAILGAVKSVGKFVYKYTIEPYVNFFKMIYGAVSSFVSTIADLAQTYIIKPFTFIFTFVSLLVTGAAKFVGGLVDQYVIQPFMVVFRFVQERVSAVASFVGGLIQQYIITPFRTVFTLVSGAVSAVWNTVSELVSTYVVTPFKTGLAFIGSAITSAWNFVSEPVTKLFRMIGKFFSDLPGVISNFIKSIPGVGSAYSAALKAAGYQSGGIVDGPRDGTVDRRPAWLTPGEFVVRQRVVDKPGVKAHLTNLNNERWDPAMLYAGLNATPQLPSVPKVNAAGVYAAQTVTNNNVNHGGLKVGDVTINNPVREKSDHSIRRTLQNLAYLNHR